MKKVEFVRVKSNFSGLGFVKGSRFSFTEVEDIIKKRIIEGWEYCGFIPLETRGVGDIETMSLIFQKEEE